MTNFKVKVKINKIRAFTSQTTQNRLIETSKKTLTSTRTNTKITLLKKLRGTSRFKKLITKYQRRGKKTNANLPPITARSF